MQVLKFGLLTKSVKQCIIHGIIKIVNEFFSSGTYNAVTRAKHQDFCLLCPPGYYCDKPGLSQPSGNCSEGYYCTYGSKLAQPPEGRCPPGSFCPAGSPVPLPCSDGKYTNVSQSAECKECPPGINF